MLINISIGYGTTYGSFNFTTYLTTLPRMSRF